MDKDYRNKVSLASTKDQLGIMTARKKNHNCLHCYKKFSNNSQLQRHLNSSGTERGCCQRRCVICRSDFRHEDFSEHIKAHHPHSVKNRCSTCGKHFEYPHMLRDHRIQSRHTRTIQSYKCTKCPQKFTSAKGLSGHMSSSHVQHKCSVCNKEFGAKYLKIHEQAHLPVESRQYQCPHCPKAYVIRSQWAIHLWSHRKEKRLECTQCGFAANNGHNMKYHMGTMHSKQSIVCPFEGCGKTFRVKNTLQSHMRIHQPEKKFKCSVCGETFRHCGTLATHKRQHTGEKPFPCSICGKKFRQNTHRITHMRTHTDERRYICPVCNKGLTQSSHLKTHMKIHTGEKNFKCGYCDKKFAHRQTWRIHERQHTNEEPYKCEVCGKTFKQASALRPHLQRHRKQKEHECDKCGKQYYEKTALSRHMNTHANIKPFTCAECDKTFSTKHGVSQHMVLHTGEKPHVCYICHKGFQHRSSYRNHLIKKHKATKKGGTMKCPYSPCDQKYTQTEDLALHISVTHKKSFTCPMCRIRFSDDRALRKHMASNVCKKPRSRLGRPPLFGDGDPDASPLRMTDVMKRCKTTATKPNVTVPQRDDDEHELDDVLPAVKCFKLPEFPKRRKRNDSWESDVSSSLCDDSSGEDEMSGDEDKPWWEKEDEETFMETNRDEDEDSSDAERDMVSEEIQRDLKLQQTCHVVLKKINMISMVSRTSDVGEDEAADVVPLSSDSETDDYSFHSESMLDDLERNQSIPNLKHGTVIGTVTSLGYRPGTSQGELIPDNGTVPSEADTVFTEITIINQPSKDSVFKKEVLSPSTQGYSDEASYNSATDLNCIEIDNKMSCPILASSTEICSDDKAHSDRKKKSKGDNTTHDKQHRPRHSSHPGGDGKTKSKGSKQTPDKQTRSRHLSHPSGDGKTKSKRAKTTTDKQTRSKHSSHLDGTHNNIVVTERSRRRKEASVSNCTRNNILVTERPRRSKETSVSNCTRNNILVTERPRRSKETSVSNSHIDLTEDSDWEVELDSQKGSSRGAHIKSRSGRTNGAVAEMHNSPNKRQSRRSKSNVKQGVVASRESNSWHYDADTCGAPWCHQPVSDKVSWIQCDACKKWFHTVCLSVSQREIQRLDEFFCGCNTYS